MMQGGTRAVAIAIAALALGACGDDSSGPPAECTGGTPIAVGATVTGTLQEGDEVDIDGAYLDRYALRVPSNGPLEITMRSTELDAYLWLLTANGTLIASDDDSGGGATTFDAQIVHNLNRGCFLVEATTFFGESGAYTLSVRRP